MSNTIKPIYGTDGVAVTITLAGLTTNASREAAAVDNSTNLFLDAYVMLKLKTGTGTINTGDPYVYVYAIGSDDSGTTWPDPATGSDAAITISNNTKAHLLGAINTPAQTTSYVGGPWSLLSAFGGVAIPKKWSIVVYNNCGVSLDATVGNFALTYQGIQAQIV